MSVNINLTNSGEYSVTVTFDGPSYKQVELDSGDAKDTFVQSGTYNVTFLRPSRRDEKSKKYTFQENATVAIDAAAIFGANLMAFASAEDITYGEHNLDLVNNTPVPVMCNFGCGESAPMIRIKPMATVQLTLKYGCTHTFTVMSGQKTEKVMIKHRSGDICLYLSSVFPLPVPESVHIVPDVHTLPNGNGKWAKINKGKREAPPSFKEVRVEEMRVESAIMALDSYV